MDVDPTRNIAETLFVVCRIARSAVGNGRSPDAGVITVSMVAIGVNCLKGGAFGVLLDLRMLGSVGVIDGCDCGTGRTLRFT